MSMILESNEAIMNAKPRRSEPSTIDHAEAIPLGDDPRGFLPSFAREHLAQLESDAMEAAAANGHLLDRVQELQAEASRLVVTDGAIRAVELGDGRTLPCRAVVITTGGIGGNHDVVRRNWPDRMGTAPVSMITGVPAAIKLLPDRTQLVADGQDTVPITAVVVDAAGRVVPTANNLVFFEFAGAGANAGVGNGDPSCHEANQANSRSAFMGYCMVLAQAGRKAGTLKVTASANGLDSTSVQLVVVKAPEA